VEEHVKPTLQETFPGIDSPQQWVYFISAIADKRLWVDQPRSRGGFKDVGKNALWQDYADRLLEKCTGDGNEA
jgi:hypothetical protein